MHKRTSQGHWWRAALHSITLFMMVDSARKDKLKKWVGREGLILYDIVLPQDIFLEDSKKLYKSDKKEKR